MSVSNTPRTISAEEIANYAVCPEAWRLKYVESDFRKPQETEHQSTQLRKEWIKGQDLSRQLSAYAKIAYLLLVALVILVFLWDFTGAAGRISAPAKSDVSVQTAAGLPARTAKTVPPEIFSLLLVLGLLIFMWDLFERRSRKLKTESGLSADSQLLSARGSSLLPARQYYSPTLGLTSKPDAVIKDGQEVIPVGVYPSTNKVQDRHVLALLASLVLVEETEKRRPAYGILVMGKNKRRVQISFTAEKERWLESIVDEMRSILEGIPAVPAPSPNKCRYCDVREICAHSMHHGKD